MDQRRLTDEQQRAWRGLTRMPGRLRQSLARGLEEVSALSVADFEVLDVLPHAPGSTLPFADLARALLWNASQLAHQVTRMEKRGLVQRVRRPCDRRTIDVACTEAGHTAHARAVASHADALRCTLLEVATEDQLTVIADVCEGVLGVLDDPDPA